MSSNIRITKICLFCQKEFEAKTTVTKYCSLQCNGKAYKANLKLAKIKESNLHTQKKRRKIPDDIKDRELLTVGQVAAMLNSSDKTVYNMINEGRLKASRLSPRKTLIRRSEIERILSKVEVTLDLRPLITPKSASIENSYTIGEIQQKFNISEKAIYDIIKKEKIPKKVKGWYTYVPKKAIDKILNPTGK